MSDLAESLMKHVLALPESDRADLAYSLLESLPTPDKTPEDAQDFDSTLSRRASELRDGTAAGIPAAEVIANLREKYA